MKGSERPAGTFSGLVQSRARSEGTVKIHSDHILHARRAESRLARTLSRSILTWGSTPTWGCCSDEGLHRKNRLQLWYIQAVVALTCREQAVHRQGDRELHPRSRAISGLSDGKMMLNDRSPPTCRNAKGEDHRSQYKLVDIVEQLIATSQITSQIHFVFHCAGHTHSCDDSGPTQQCMQEGAKADTTIWPDSLTPSTWRQERLSPGWRGRPATRTRSRARCLQHIDWPMWAHWYQDTSRASCAMLRLHTLQRSSPEDQRMGVGTVTRLCMLGSACRRLVARRSLPSSLQICSPAGQAAAPLRASVTLVSVSSGVYTKPWKMGTTV